MTTACLANTKWPFQMFNLPSISNADHCTNAVPIQHKQYIKFPSALYNRDFHWSRRVVNCLQSISCFGAQLVYAPRFALRPSPVRLPPSTGLPALSDQHTVPQIMTSQGRRVCVCVSMSVCTDVCAFLNGSLRNLAQTSKHSQNKNRK